ncbi:MAG: hypothetical protein JOZ16_12875 [Methylobacteriaceae bacterium]|nr:hypothetical protein [Methylobacteriaceae bacterium]
MKKFALSAAAAGAIVAASALGAQAMPAAPVSSDTAIVQVRDGCGPGMHLSPWGCKPNGWRRPAVVVREPGWRRPGWRGPAVVVRP